MGLSNAPFSENDPWLPAGATQTQGNNVHAYADLAAPDGLNPGDDGQCGDNLARDFRACVTAPGVFDYTYDAALGAQANQTQAAASVVNLFLASSALAFGISVLGVLIFAGLTAWDTQRIKEMYYEMDDSASAARKSVLGALMLYLDFINMFVMLMQLFGQQRSS